MENKEKLVKVSFWAGEKMREEINEFAHGISLSASDFYKAGAILLKNLIEKGTEINLNIFTRSFKDFENRELQKKIQKAYKGGRSVY